MYNYEYRYQSDSLILLVELPCQHEQAQNLSWFIQVTMSVSEYL